MLAGIVAGLATAFSTSIWFSAVEGEVYAMSTMFTAISLWAATKYYYKDNDDEANRWLVLSLFVTGYVSRCPPFELTFTTSNCTYGLL